MEISELLIHADIYSEKHALSIGMSRYIYQRARYYSKISEPWRQLIELRAGFHHDWRGFKIRPGAILTPSGDQVTAAEIDSMRYGEQLAFERGRLQAEEIQLKLVWNGI